MSGAETTIYLDILLKVYEEKIKRFRLLLTILLVGTSVLFFLIFFPYMTLIGNREDCRANQQQCTQLEKSKLEERFSDVTTSWGKIPISTAEATVLFPVGVAFSFIAVVAQLQGLMRIRRAITQQVKALSSHMDVTLIAPLLIDPKQSLVEQISGGMTLVFPALVFLYSVRIILIRLQILRNKLPYFQNTRFYYLIYLLTALLGIYSLVKIGFCFYKYKKDI